MKYEEKREKLLAERTEIIDKCEGCNHIDGKFCEAYLYPDKKWRLGNCNFATNIKTEEEEKKVRVGQQKGKRRKN